MGIDMGYEKPTKVIQETISSLAELREILNSLTPEELNAQTNSHDWYDIDITVYPSGAYFIIDGRNGE
jgi:hypothetical protein